MIRFEILGGKGDVALDYDIETAERKFDELLSDGLIPFVKEKDNEALVKAKTFKDVQKTAEKVTWIPRIAGG